MLPLCLVTYLNTKLSLNYVPFLRMMFTWRLPSPMCPQPSTKDLDSFLKYSSRLGHSLTSKEMSYAKTLPYYLTAATATSSRIFQILLYYLSLLDMMESLKPCSSSNSESKSSVDAWTNKRCSSSFTESKISGCRCLTTVWQVCPSMYQSAARFFPNFLLISGRLCNIFSKASVLNTMIFLMSSIFSQWMLSLVMMPMVPSPPMKRCFRSKPVLSLWIQERRSRMSPLGSTASRPRMCERKEPYFITYLPPALVEAFPPIWQEPFAPRSSGVSKPKGSMYSLSFSRMTPASQPTMELTSLNPSILFMFLRFTMISSKTGTLPPTRPVFPP